MFSSQIYCVTFVNHRCTGGFTYFALHFIHATFCIEPRKMTVEDITDDFDTTRDPSVPALLWEVRRERRVELMGEGFRLDDLRRWKKGDYVNKRPLGVYVTGASAKNLKVTGGPSNDEGYVYFFDAPLGWQEHYYLYPLPLKQLALNTNLEQNPVWTK